MRCRGPVRRENRRKADGSRVLFSSSAERQQDPMTDVGFSQPNNTSCASCGRPNAVARWWNSDKTAEGYNFHAVTPTTSKQRKLRSTEDITSQETDAARVRRSWAT